jgi:hypothetical protein
VAGGVYIARVVAKTYFKAAGFAPGTAAIAG